MFDIVRFTALDEPSLHTGDITLQSASNLLASIRNAMADVATRLINVNYIEGSYIQRVSVVYNQLQSDCCSVEEHVLYGRIYLAGVTAALLITSTIPIQDDIFIQLMIIYLQYVHALLSTADPDPTNRVTALLLLHLLVTQVW